MTEEQFLEELSNIDGWLLEKKTYYEYQIRKNKYICPICAVCNKLYLTTFSRAAGYANRYLNLSDKLLNTIVMAADSNLWTGDVKDMHNKLLKACKLS